jgi:hypothetical protein
MLRVQIRLDGGNIAATMAEMREWLDRHHLEPDQFTYRMDADLVHCRLDFRLPTEAAAFAEAFADIVVG